MMFKLFERYKNVIGDLGNIKRAYFTSFNFGCPFFENYLLPALVDIDRPKNLSDYEHIQFKLTESQVDIQVWVDGQYFDVREPKRFAYDLHLVDMKKLNGFSRSQVFHPKVIFLEGEDGGCYIGAGSANLSVAAWSSNIESYQFEKIQTNAQFDSIRHFFLELGVSDFGQFSGDIVDSLESWKFVHSFQTESFWNQFKVNSNCSEIDVMSPYFSSDLNKSLAMMFPESDNILNIIPDLSSGKIRLQSLPDHPNVKTQFYALSTKDSDRFVHAKVWRSESKLAVGSWNFTRPAMGLAGENRSGNNVEAGFIYSNKKGNLDKNKMKKIDNPKQYIQTESESDEMPTVQNTLVDFVVEVTYDWQLSQYHVNLIRTEDQLEDENEKYSLKLPDYSQEIEFNKEFKSSTLHIVPKEIYKNKLFEIKFTGGRSAFGVIRELKVDFRKSFQYENINDFFDAFQSDEPETLKSGQVIHGLSGIEESTSDPSIDIDIQTPEISYFRFFQAFLNMKRKFSKTTDVSLFQKMILVHQGNLTELKEKCEKVILDTNKNSKVLRWFLYEEYNALVHFVRQLDVFTSLEPHIQGEVTPLSDEFQVDMSTKNSDNTKRKRYLKTIKSKIAEGIS